MINALVVITVERSPFSKGWTRPRADIDASAATYSKADSPES